MGSAAPWMDDAEIIARRSPVSAEVEAWAKALCCAYGVNPDTLIGKPQEPRWRSFAALAEMAMKAKKIIEGEL